MKTNDPTDYVARHSILSLLTEEEAAFVSAPEAVSRLSDGDQYLDLEQLDQGVRLVTGAMTPMGRVLPRSAVHASTWRKVLTHLAAHRLATAHFGAGRRNA